MFPPNIKKQEALLEMFMRPKMNLSKNLFFGHMNTFLTILFSESYLRINEHQQHTLI